MKKTNILLLFIILFLSLNGCDKSEEESTVILKVLPNTILYPIAPNNTEVEHMIVIDEFNQTDYLTIGDIKYFEYEKGFEYKLLVKKKYLKNPPQDSGNIIYILLELLSKEKVNEE